jgi:hypothetical protein
MLNFFKKKPENKLSFNILDESTWHLASNSSFIWKNDVKFSNEETGKNITEKEFLAFIVQVIGALRQASSDQKLNIAGLPNIIVLIIDLLSAGINANNALVLINSGLENNIDFSWSVFTVNQPIGINNKVFDANSPDTWKFATENNLIWESRPFNISPEKKFTEILFVKIMTLLFYTPSVDLYSSPDLLNLNISTLLAGLKQDKSTVDILNQISSQLKIISTPGSADNRAFDIFDMNTWDSASDKVFEWEGKKIKHHPCKDRPASEKEIIDFVGGHIKVFESDSEINQKQKEIGKINVVTHIFNYLICGMDWGEVSTEAIRWITNYNPNDGKSKFDISNISTWKFASEKYIVWNNRLVYDKDEVPITEKGAVNLFNSIYAFLERNGEKLTSEYKIEKAKGLLNKLISPIKTKSNDEGQTGQPPTAKSLGGYGFTRAQLEVLGSLSDTELSSIGKTMSSGLSGGGLEQALFNAHGDLNRDWHYLAKLNDLNVAWEKKIMLEYFYEYEFETEEELNELLKESEYLKDHNELKVKIYEHFKERFTDDYYTELYDSLEIKEDVNNFINKDEYLKHHPVFKAELLKKYEELIIKDREEQSKSINIKKFTIHDDIKQLLWFADGPLKNLTKEQMKHDKGAISLKIQFEHNNPRIIAMCEELNLTIDEPSLIYTKKAIIQPQDELNVPDPYYFPGYKNLSPEQRWIYLRFLENPYNTYYFDTGYVFILYYGLERHLLQGDFDNAFKVIMKLRDVHANKSFQKYSGNAVILSSLLRNKGEYALEFVKSLDKEYKFHFSDNLLLMCYYSFNIPLLPKDIIRMAKTFGFTKTNYIKKSHDVFEKCLLNIMKEKIGAENIDIKKYISDSELNNLSYEDTPIYANSSIIGDTVPVPMITSNSNLRNEINILLELAHEATKVKLAEMRKVVKTTTTSGILSQEDL